MNDNKEKKSSLSDTVSLTLTNACQGQRLDATLAQMFPDFSRAFLQRSIKQGLIRVNEEMARPRDLMAGGEQISLMMLDTAVELTDAVAAEEIPLQQVYADADIIVIYKPAGLVMHPAAGHRQGTLMNALLYHYPDLQSLPRAGIIHRLDKDTSGLLVVARTLTAHKKLIEQMQQRKIVREYFCLVHGQIFTSGSIEAPVGRHPRQRKQMAVVASGRPAISHYKVIQRFEHATLLRLRLETGRTHQIRIHMHHIQHPVWGDPVYGRRRLSKHFPAETPAGRFCRQALHACHLGLQHPSTNKFCTWDSKMPDDMQQLLDFFMTAKSNHA